ncbi:hypothetical protein MTR_3g081190 [Medicago truncatula]|uniref:Uncharacterized protein n=1 Tax=Medicago truncatula TaxID=3880 RepID=A0A072V1B0_MEDTR|nr:hypothetical protein MTR_3g081190 [Medicago truncatula]
MVGVLASQKKWKERMVIAKDQLQQHPFHVTSSIINACLTWLFHKAIPSKFPLEENEKDSKSRLTLDDDDDNNSTN